MSKSNRIPSSLAAAVAAALPMLALAQGAPPAAAPASATAQAGAARAEAPLDPKAASYSLGLYFGSQLHASGLSESVTIAELERGLHDGIGGKQASDADRQLTSQWMRSGRDGIAAHNRAEARDFLATNAKVAGVKTTASGLQYTVVEAGDASAPSPKATDAVTVEYRGRLLDGSMFDSSDAHGEPARFNLNGGVIPGMKEALLAMKPDAQWRVFLPPDLAYGDSGRPNIPPGSALVFDIHLVRIEAPKVLGQGKNPAGQAIAPAPTPARKGPAR
jgi:FKBP-type peptidyl-prolyl cis-trans isomerase